MSAAKTKGAPSPKGKAAVLGYAGADTKKSRVPRLVAAPKPRPRLFWTLLLLWVLWIAALVTLYFTTVYPHRARQTSAISNRQ
jgi:hypothetical protein